MGKAMKAMKAKKRSSIIGRGRLAKVQVLKGAKSKTVGGLTAKDLVKNKSGRVVSRKRSQIGKKSEWMKACQSARKALGIKGFCAVGGKKADGKALYAKAKEIYGQ